jgi:hypothetical protein
MARNQYANGDEIVLACGCNGCSPAVIQGVLCHEQGCPDAWRDHEVECYVCGCDFYPEYRNQTVCDDCMYPPEFDDADEEEG